MNNIMQAPRIIRIFILLSWIPLIAIKAYSIEIKEVNMDPECENELYAEENFDFLPYLNKFSERLKNYNDEKGHLCLSPTGKGLKVVHNERGDFGHVEYCKLYFNYYNRYNNNPDPSRISFYEMEVFVEQEDQDSGASLEIKLHARCSTKHIIMPENIFGTWVSYSSLSSKFLEKGHPNS